MQLYCYLLCIAMFLGCSKPQQEPPHIAVEMSQLAPEAAAAINAQLSVVEKSPSDGAAWHTLGLLYQAHGLGEAAVEAYEYAKHLTSDPKTLYLLSITYARLGEYEKAIANAKLVQGYTPSLWKQGYWLLDLGQFDQAAMRFEKAIEQTPTAVAAHIGLVRVRIAQDKPKEAIVLLETLRSRGADHPYLTYLLGIAHQRAGHRELADSLLQMPLVGPPSWDDPWTAEMRAMQRGFGASLSRAIKKIDDGNLQGALVDFQAIAKNHPRNPTVINNLAIVYLNLGDTDKALQILAQSIRWTPTYAPSHFTMARVLLQIGELDRAASYVDAAIKLQPAMAVAYALGGRIAVTQRKLDSARQYLTNAVAIGTNNPATREMLAMVLLDLGEDSLALEQFKLVLRIAPNRTVSIGGVAVVTARNGNYKNAMQMINDAKKKFPNDAQIERAYQVIRKMRGTP